MKKKLNLYLIILTILGVIISLYPKLTLRTFYKTKTFINNVKLSKLIKNNDCSFTVLNEIPDNSSIIIGHLYGSPSKHNNFIDKNAEKFLLKNRKKIKNLFLTGDIFSTPSREKWTRFYNLFDKDIRIFITPGNHDIGREENFKIFKESVNQSTDFPIIYEDNNIVYIFENSIKSGWHIQKNTFEEIKKIDKNSQVILLRHNIAARELIPLANSKSLLKRDLPYSKEIENLLNRNIIIISGDGGAFKKLPRIFCRTYGNIKYIINGLGGIEGDSIIVIHDNEIFSYVLKDDFNNNY